MTKKQSVLISAGWTLLIVAFPITSGVIVSLCQADRITIRLVQTIFMLISLFPIWILGKKRKRNLDFFYLASFRRGGTKKVLFYVPLLAILIFMASASSGFESRKYVLAAGVFTLSVGIAEELYFRSVILRTL